MYNFTLVWISPFFILILYYVFNVLIFLFKSTSDVWGTLKSKLSQVTNFSDTSIGHCLNLVNAGPRKFADDRDAPGVRLWHYSPLETPSNSIKVLQLPSGQRHLFALLWIGNLLLLEIPSPAFYLLCSGWPWRGFKCERFW